MSAAARRPFALLLALATMGCAPAHLPESRPAGQARPQAQAHHRQEFPVWRVADVAAVQGRRVSLRSSSGVMLVIETARARLVDEVARKIQAAAGPGEAPDWLLIGTPGVNAYASYDGAQPVVTITLGMVALLGDDRDAWAALLGHEIAHFRLGHHEAMRTRRQATDVGSSIAGIALSLAGLGFGSAVADAGGKLVERAFNRDDEREADRVGLDILGRAGFDGRGALRLQQALLEANKGAATPGFLSTHPGGEERIERLRALIDAPAK